jgi:mono/diheme cytochrome c family protein
MKYYKFAIFILLLAGCTMSKKLALLSETNPFENDPLSVQRGEALYKNNCASCHGPRGLGDGPEIGKLPITPASLIGKSSNTAAVSITFGKGEFMPSFKDILSKDEIWDVSNYVASLQDTE